MIGELGRLRPARLLAIAVFLVVLALPGAARAAVVIGATNSASSTTGTVSFPLTVAPGNDRIHRHQFTARSMSHFPANLRLPG